MFLAPTPPMTVARVTVPNGRAGVFHTVRVMRRYVDDFKRDPRIIQAAVSIIYGVPEKDELSEARALFEYVRDYVRYVRDVTGIETLADPVTTLARMVGDCDDQTTLLATLMESVGYETRFVLAGYSSRAFEHVYMQVLAGGAWISCDPIEHNEFGWAPPDPVVIDYERN